MRKLLLLLLGVLIALPSAAQTFEYEYKGQTLVYDILDPDAKTCQVGRNDTDISGDVEIPSVAVYNDAEYTVTKIFGSTYFGAAFLNCTSLTSVVIPNSITEIGIAAFRGCTSLTSVVLPDILTTIGDDAFNSCEELSSIEIPHTVTSIGKAAFLYCYSLTSVQLPEGLNALENQTFYYCTSLVSVHLPTSLTTIGESVFTGCRLLSSIEIPASVTTIGEEAFRYCEKLTSVVIPHSVKSLESYVFDNCTSLSSVEIPNSVTTIGDQAFLNCHSLTSIKLPNSLTKIGKHAFSRCSGLTAIEIPNTVTTIGNNAFTKCSNLRRVIIPKSVTSIGNYAFSDCSSLATFIILSTDVNLGYDIFLDTYVRYAIAPEGLDCSALNCTVKTYNPETTEILEDGTMLTDNGKTLYYVYVEPGGSYAIPEGVTKVLAGAIDTSPSAGIELESLTIPSTIEEIEANTFRYAEIGKVNFTDWPAWFANAKLGNLYANPYWNSTPYVGGIVMTTPELKEGMTEIPDYIDYGLQFKDEVELPTTIKRIGAYAFYRNKELYSVILPARLEEIGESAFEGCELLENPKFPAGLKKIEEGAYKNCTQISEITLPSGLNYLGDRNPVIEIEGIPWDINNKGVFEGCKALERAVIVADIDYIDDKLFYGCSNLQTLFLPLELKTIGNYAFYNCNLDEITLPSTLETIGDYSFAYSVDDWGYDYNWGYGEYGKITNLVIPNGVTNIGDYAFMNQGITNLHIGSGLKTISRSVFQNNHIQIVNFSEGLEEIGYNAFANNSYGISTVNLPSTVTIIGGGAFKNTPICEMNVPDGVTSLPQGSCGSPSILSLGSGIKDIDAKAFSFEKLYTIRLKAHTPPTLSDAFPLTEAQNDQLTLIVNPGRHDYYTTNARWKQIDNIIEEGQSDVTIYMTGNNAISTEIRLTTGLMPSSVTKMKVVGPLTANDLVIIKENMAALTSLDMSEVTNVTAIPDYQFYGSMLTDIVLPAKLESIGSSAFAECGLLQIEELPASLKTIGSYAFSGSVRVDISSLPESLETIGYNAFSGTAIRSIVANEALAELGDAAFSNCTQLETVDLSASALTAVPSGAFSGCYELDEVLLPETVTAIGPGAFSGTALRNIDFVSSVNTIGSNAFSGNRRLVAATLPESLQTVGAYMFSDCPRLIAVSMPSTTTTVSTQILNGDRKLANISCAALSAPEAESGAFDGLRMRYVSLIVPTLSFQSYLDAPGWGKFQTIKNIIPVEIDEGVDASVVSEEEYQQMLEEDALEEAEDAAAQEQNPEAEPMARRRAAQRAATPQYFASLFNGAQIQTGDDDSGMRVFVHPKDGVNITSILFDGEEMLPYYLEHGSVLLPKGSEGSLQILTDAVIIEPAIELNVTEAKIDEGASVQLSATVTGLEDTAVTWSSSDESIATVDPTGLVRGIHAGVAVITAKTVNGLTASCQVTVEEVIIEPTGITLNVSEVTIEEGEVLQLTATIAPTDATDQSVTWSSSDTGVVTVDVTGLITAEHAGVAVITAKTVNGLTANCQVTVEAKIIEPNDISLNVTEAKILEGETVQLTATVTPADATDQTVIWSSNDEAIATVDQNGLVSGVKMGTVVITASTVNGLTAQCVVTVDEMTGIGDVDADISVVVRDRKIIVTAPEDTEVGVYSTGGMCVALTREHKIEIAVDGVYFVRVADRVFKVIVR